MPPSLMPRSKRASPISGADPFATSPTRFGKFIAEYIEKWRKVLRAANIKAE